MSSFLVITNDAFSNFAIIIIKIPAVKKRTEARNKGESSETATLLNKYVEPQIR